MIVMARSRKFFLLLKCVVVEFFDTITITIHALAHTVVKAINSKSPAFIVRAGAGRCDLLLSLIFDLVNVQFAHIFSTQAQ